MDERKNNNHPWDDSVYGTGRTEPPKSHGGTVALLLILIIFLCGIITVLGVLNVRLFQKLNTRRESEQSISFATGAELPAETTALPTESIDATLGEDTPTIDLQKCPQGVENVPTEGALSLQKIYSRNIDSVVSITSTGQGATATGTGVILTEDGYIVTNCHVVENGISITAQLTDGRTLPAMLVGADSVSDLAVLHIDTTGLTPAQFGDSDSLRVGDTVVAIGDPLGVTLRGTSTALARVNEENLRVVADLTNVSDADGVYTVPATVYVDGLDVHDDVGADGLLVAFGDRVAVRAGGLPLIGLLRTVLLRADGDAVRDHERGVEAHAELADDVDIGVLLVLFLGLLAELVGARRRDDTEVVFKLFAAHTDAVIRDRQRAVLLVDRHRDGKIAAVHADLVVRQRDVTELVDSVAGVGNDLAQEDLLVRVDRIDHHIKQTL